ncbi:MAG: hypothetical protein NE334_21700 [Lentisphaeraceae bacterium]|nr:hypothetical protein [Lentisphaeraceae bacterium]
MALIICKECRKKYSSNAKSCPECGNPTPTNEENTKKKMSFKSGCLIFFVFLMIAGLLSPNSDESNLTTNSNSEQRELAVKKKKEKLEALKKQKLEALKKQEEKKEKELKDFKTNSASVLISLDRMLINKDLEGMNSLLKKYENVENKELNKFRSQYQSISLKKELSNLPENEFSKRIQVLKQLLQLYPESKDYKTKLAHNESSQKEKLAKAILTRIKDLSDKKNKTKNDLKQLVKFMDQIIAIGYKPKEFQSNKAKYERLLNILIKKEQDQKALKIAKEKRKKKLESYFSAWDGSHVELVRVVKKRMNDPSSFEHVETKYTDRGKNGVILFMTFRGKNAFGGKVLNNVKALWLPEKNTITFLEI